MNLPPLFDALVNASKATLSTPGAKPELSVMPHFDRFLGATIGDISSDPILVVQQANADQIGVPDFRIQRAGELLGWVELKEVTGTKELGSLSGHDKTQRDKFVAGLHNLVLTDGWQWELYQDGKLVKRAAFDRDLFTTHQPSLPNQASFDALVAVLELFTTFRAADYGTAEAAVVALALRAKALKLALIELGEAGAGGHLGQLKRDFDSLLYRHGQPFTWAKFVDSYVQIATFGALLWRLETKADIGLAQQVNLKAGLHPLLYQCLAIMWSPQSQLPSLVPLLDDLCRTVNLIPPLLFTSPVKKGGKRKYLADPIVNAYEPFFRFYDQAAREANGVYYTPVEIVQHIVSGVDDLLRGSLGKPDGILSDDARFLDPATGTGTFLLGLANEVAHEAAKVGLPTDQVVHEVLTERTSAFELFPGPYTIAHQRLEALLESLGTPATKRLPVYLADTLAAPESGQLPMSGFGMVGDEIVEERQRADWIKTGEEILVILGNPPYERVKASAGATWEPFAAELMQQVVDATPLDRRLDLKSATDLFVAFWAWALWALRNPSDRAGQAQKPFIDTRANHGIVGFITNRTWIIGPSLVGLRALVRRGVKEVWVYDLGGDARGSSGAKSFAGGDANVFGIQTGVAIVWLVFDRNHSGTPTVRYRRTFGKKAAKLAALDLPFDRNQFMEISDPDVFVPVVWPPALAAAASVYDLFRAEPETGIQSARDTSRFTPWGTEPESVYAVTPPTKLQSLPTLHGSLGAWAQLSSAAARTEGWKTADATRRKRKTPDPATLTAAKVQPAQYRPLDIRYVYNDESWLDWPRENLQRAYEQGPVPTLITLPRDFGAGPLAVHTVLLPEQHSFKGVAGAKGVFPLWLPADGAPDDGFKVVDGRLSNLADRTLQWAGAVFPGSADHWQDAYDYLLASLSAPAYSEQLWPTLEAAAPRVPLSKDAALCTEGVVLGRRLRDAWDLRVLPTGIAWDGKATTPQLGTARWEQGRVAFSNGRSITGVPQAAWTFSVSNYVLLPEWFAARRHWTATLSQAHQALKVIAAAAALSDLQQELDDWWRRLVS